ncbi:hypothetical protein [Streptomyces virginiae]|uniref:hypothetical protein n=1 Tax=Streptomyces virginiae TaxID=1961 RepID=UPI002258CCDC|nr:hypothetical protein [Streptomyces virginiae]MCX5278055.1 hypothetical protein [Streptomyces virginiae]
MDFIDRRPASPDRPQAAYRRALRLARVAARYADPYARTDISVHRQDFHSDGAEYLSVTTTDWLHGTEAHLTVTLEIGESGRARPDSGALTLKGLGDDAVWRLVGALSPLAAPVPPKELWQPRGSWWKRHRFLNPRAWHDSLRDKTDAFAASAVTANGCRVDLYAEGCNHQLNIGIDAEGAQGPAETQRQLSTLVHLFARWGDLSAARSAYVRGAPSPLPL